jgi:hypothetical protein
MIDKLLRSRDDDMAIKKKLFSFQNTACLLNLQKLKERDDTMGPTTLRLRSSSIDENIISRFFVSLSEAMSQFIHQVRMTHPTLTM